MRLAVDDVDEAAPRDFLGRKDGAGVHVLSKSDCWLAGEVSALCTRARNSDGVSALGTLGVALGGSFVRRGRCTSCKELSGDVVAPDTIPDDV